MSPLQTPPLCRAPEVHEQDGERAGTSRSGASRRRLCLAARPVPAVLGAQHCRAPVSAEQSWARRAPGEAAPGWAVWAYAHPTFNILGWKGRFLVRHPPAELCTAGPRAPRSWVPAAPAAFAADGETHQGLHFYKGWSG